MGMRTHARLSGNTSGNHHNVGTSKCFLEAIIGWQESLDLGRGSDMRKVHGHTRSVYDIIQSKLYQMYHSLSELMYADQFTSVTAGLDFRRSDKGWPIPPVGD